LELDKKRSDIQALEEEENSTFKCDLALLALEVEKKKTEIEMLEEQNRKFKGELAQLPLDLENQKKKEIKALEEENNRFKCELALFILFFYFLFWLKASCISSSVRPHALVA
jgi:hypothetical protein